MTSFASPNVSLDDPAYDELAALRARGLIPLYLGGLRPLSERRLAALLGRVATDDDWWVRPVERAQLQLRWFDEDARSYSTPLRPRDIAGALALSCEHGEGRPCGDGAGGLIELDSSVGYRDLVSGSVRLATQVGDREHAYLELERAYVLGEVGPVALEAGRDVLVFGPSARTQLGWGDNAPPLDHVRISTAQPFRLTDSLRANAQYAVGQLRAPQRYPGALASISRVQLDIGDVAEVGAMQLLELGGDGAPSLGVWDFVAEHVRRGNASAGPNDTSNRRFGGDVSLHVTELGARFYYQVMFEDIRRARWIDAVRYDADHLLGLELAAIGRHALVVELHETGFRSQEHTPRTTGFTNRGFAVGSPLGPDASSIYAGARIAVGAFVVSPWCELARLASDTYELVTDGPINRTSVGEDEVRYRTGLRIRVPLTAALRLEGAAELERVGDFGFVTGATRTNAGITASIIWYPRGPLGRLSLR